ncbi:GDCCVxC domain-containing (seleno)protein [Pistricoccus aurantiacus]|uniref:GDCCVxC domain-containing (seleno)protein n=1 Tax=Pistricoccus aurantiacus TaxID=1883414 RepID=UPI0036402EC5
MSLGLILESTLTCPLCGQRSVEVMMPDACQWFYHCSGCGSLLQPMPGDCCVFCSYGTVVCAPAQLAESTQNSE